jgi:hypothetical protein
MSTVQSIPPELFLNGVEDHRAEFEKLQLEQMVLRCVLAAQNKLDTIRAEYGVLRSLVSQIRELKTDEPHLRPQRNFLEALVDQEARLDVLATSLIRFLD